MSRRRVGFPTRPLHDARLLSRITLWNSSSRSFSRSFDFLGSLTHYLGREQRVFFPGHHDTHLGCCERDEVGFEPFREFPGERQVAG